MTQWTLVARGDGDYDIVVSGFNAPQMILHIGTDINATGLQQILAGMQHALDTRPNFAQTLSLAAERGLTIGIYVSNYPGQNPGFEWFSGTAGRASWPLRLFGGQRAVNLPFGEDARIGIDWGSVRGQALNWAGTLQLPVPEMIARSFASFFGHELGHPVFGAHVRFAGSLQEIEAQLRQDPVYMRQMIDDWNGGVPTVHTDSLGIDTLLTRDNATFERGDTHLFRTCTTPTTSTRRPSRKKYPCASGTKRVRKFQEGFGMPRSARIVAAGAPHHVTQRGNRRQITFFRDADYVRYLQLAAEWCAKAEVECWGYCLMPNHVHLILTPKTEAGLRAALSPLHWRYTYEINKRERWTGYLWQGRFASYPMDDAYFIQASRYVGLNPVRAGLVARAQDWPWSSVHALLRSKDDALVRTGPLLGVVRQDMPRFFETDVAEEAKKKLRRAASTGRPLGGAEWLKQFETAAHR